MKLSVSTLAERLASGESAASVEELVRDEALADRASRPAGQVAELLSAPLPFARLVEPTLLGRSRGS